LVTAPHALAQRVADRKLLAGAIFWFPHALVHHRRSSRSSRARGQRGDPRPLSSKSSTLFTASWVRRSTGGQLDRSCIELCIALTVAFANCAISLGLVLWSTLLGCSGAAAAVIGERRRGHLHGQLSRRGCALRGRCAGGGWGRAAVGAAPSCCRRLRDHDRLWAGADDSCGARLRTGKEPTTTHAYPVRSVST